MNRKDIEKLANDPRFVPGIYNYCDRWRERCASTSQCLTYALTENDGETNDVNNKAFWDKLEGIFKVTLEMVEEKAEELGIKFDPAEMEEIGKENERIRKKAAERPYSTAAKAYIKMVTEWFAANGDILEEKATELEGLAQADIPGTEPEADFLKIKDCVEVIRWYQHFIFVKLCRAATGMMREESGEYFLEDAVGSTKIAKTAIERSIAAWGGLMRQLPEKEDGMLDMLVCLKGILKMLADEIKVD